MSQPDAPSASPVQDEPKPPRSLPRELIQKRRVALFGVALAFELAIFFSALTYPINPAQQQALVHEARGLLNGTTTQGTVGLFAAISANNMRVALLEMVPVAGAFLFVFSIVTTGQVIQALAVSSHLPGPVFGLALFFFPFAILELSAYAIAVASGSMLVLAWRRKSLRRELRVYCLEIIVVAVTILLAAALETVGIENPIVSFALWLPTALGMAALVVIYRSGNT